MTGRLPDLAGGGILLAAVLVLWRRELAAIVRLLAVQGALVAAVPALLAVHGADREATAELLAVAAGTLLLKAAVLPAMLRRVLARSGEARETEPLVNVTASLLAAAALTLLVYAVAQPMVRPAPSTSTLLIPVDIAVVLLGFFVLVTRRRALSQVVGFLLLDNGIATTAFLATAGVPLVVELGVALDLLFVVLVLQVLTARLQATFGATDIDGLRELHD